MPTNIFLEQLAQRLDGDLKALDQAQETLRSMLDRKRWELRDTDGTLPPDIEQIETMLDRSNVFYRYITLTDRWWTRCTGYMVGFMNDDNTPVLLKPGFTNYTFIHPKTGQAMTASKNADQLDKKAMITCLPFTEGQLTVKDILQRILHLIFNTHHHEVTGYLYHHQSGGSTEKQRGDGDDQSDVA